MSWNLAPKHQLLLSGPDVARTFQSPLKPHRDDKNKNKKAGRPFSHIAQRKQAGFGPAGAWVVLLWSPECEPGPACQSQAFTVPGQDRYSGNQPRQGLDH